MCMVYKLKTANSLSSSDHILYTGTEMYVKRNLHCCGKLKGCME